MHGPTGQLTADSYAGPRPEAGGEEDDPLAMPGREPNDVPAEFNSGA